MRNWIINNILMENTDAILPMKTNVWTKKATEKVEMKKTFYLVLREINVWFLKY